MNTPNVSKSEWLVCFCSVWQQMKTYVYLSGHKYEQPNEEVRYNTNLPHYAKRRLYPCLARSHRGRCFYLNDLNPVDHVVEEDVAPTMLDVMDA
jgi:hypothetical protein